MNKTNCVLAVTLCLCTAAYSPPARAWSLFVHELICEMALMQLSESHRKEVKRLSIGEHSIAEYQGFGPSCIWPDISRSTTHLETSEYHYMNVPREAEFIDFGRDCGAYDCVHQAVIRYARYLNDPRSNDFKRAEALRFVGHFVADLHQPLHAGFYRDKGGNDLFVALEAGGRPENNLHAIWDGNVAIRLGLGNREDVDVAVMLKNAKTQVNEISPQQVQDWRDPRVKKWVRESHSYGRSCGYRLNCDPGARFLKNGDVLSKEYWDRAKPIVSERIKMASVRLALLLELALDGKLDSVSLESE